MVEKNERASKKQLKKCRKIVVKVDKEFANTINLGYINGNLPEGVVMVIGGDGMNIYFVHLRKKKCVPYIIKGEFKMKRMKGKQLRVFVKTKEENKENESELNHYVATTYDDIT